MQTNRMKSENKADLFPAATACAEKAEALAPGWTDRALRELRSYAKRRQRAHYGGIKCGPFTCEDFRNWAAGRLDMPHDLRAFGAVMSKAQRLRIIQRKGYAPAASSHGSPKPAYVPGVEA